MPITGASLSDWSAETSRLVAAFTRDFASRFGYPPGGNSVVEADPEAGRAARDGLVAAGVQGDLPDLYRHIAAVSLPDVGNGYFVHPAEDVAGAPGNGQPTELTGAVTDTITVFGSDGGGGLFAVGGSGAVYRLHGGSLLGSVYDAEDSGVEVIAPDLWGFLRYLRDRVAEEAA